MYSRIQAIFGSRYILFWVVLSAFVLTLPSLWTGLSCDDYTIRSVLLGQRDYPGLPVSVFDAYNFVNGNPEVIAEARETGYYPWWTPDEFQISFWRPLGCLTHWLDFRYFDKFPWLMHLHSLLWYALLAGVVVRAFQRFIPVPWVAGLAAFLYVADEARSIGVGWLCGRSMIISAIIGLLVLMAHDRWRREKWRPGLFLAVFWLILGLLTAEATLSICAYLFSYALFMDRDKPLGRLVSLLPYGIVAVLWRTVYVRMGYKVVNSGLYIDPGRDLGQFVVEGSKHLMMLLYTQFAFPDAVLWTFLAPPWSLICLVLAVAVLVFIAWGLWPVIRRDMAARFFACGMVVSALPVCTTLPGGRLLFFVGFGGMGLIAVFLAAVFEKRKDILSRRPYAARWLANAFVFFHLILAPVLLPPGMFLTFFMGRPNVLAARTLPEPLSQQDGLVFVNVPSSLMIGYLPHIRQALGYPSLPDRRWLLSADFCSLEVYRNDDRTLTLRPENGFFASPWARTFRNGKIPFNKGEARKLPGLLITVTEITGDGRPAEVRYEFDVPLEDSSLRWLVWTADGFVPFSLPLPGKAVLVKRLPLLWWLRFS